MKIGIFNPYLETKGGGEKVCLTLASLLAKQNDVTMITHGKVNLEDLGHYFDIDLSRVKTLVVTPKFISKAANRLPLPGGIKHFFADLSVYRAIKKSGFDLFVNNCFQSNLPNTAPHGVYMCMFPQKITVQGRNSPIKAFYLFGLRWLYRLTLHTQAKHAIDTYDVITANSRYTQGYIKKYWGTDSSVLYPICDNMADKKPPKKAKIILNVGRFFEKQEANHHKKQDFLLETFKKMEDMHSKGWQLHFAGSVAEDTGTLKYILKLLKESRGYPIYFHFNAPRDELKKLYNQSSIYWHATGYGENPNKNPITQEHFGITTVEAMSAGAVPVVFNSAGQKESVENGKNGFLWSSQEELINYTKRVANLSPAKLGDLKQNTKKTATKFGGKAFANLVDTIFGPLMN